MKTATLRKLFTITVPMLVAATLALAVAVEAWVRWRWDPLKGTPGFFESDPVRHLRPSPGYAGWFAGVPVHINSFGFRDDREYELAKGPRTFRILVLGDSVTFGHGSVSEHTYPRLFEQRLKAWRPDIDWQVWNLGVPGYNTSQELAQLLQVGPMFQPDLVVIGFYENDLVDNELVPAQLPRNTAKSVALSMLRRHLYSLELYRRVYLTLRWNLEAKNAFRERLEHLAVDDELLAQPAQVKDLAQQELTPIERLTDEQVRMFDCYYGMKPNPKVLEDIQRDAKFPIWLDAVRRLQALNASGQYRVLFFLNYIPPVCPDHDMFYDGGSAAINDFFVRIMSHGAPTVSAYDELRHHRPSQMPNACCHAIGNTNAVKAGVLFNFVRDRIERELPAR
jgi:lysophospholipase L1-like esterase